METGRLAVVIMAAGKGTRMKNPDKAKVMYPIDGQPMIYYVVDLSLRLRSEQVIVIVGHQRQSVMEFLGGAFPGKVQFAEQNEQLGTGHAVQQSEPFLRNFQGDIIVLSGDVPLLTEDTMQRLIAEHRRQNAVATMLTTIMEDPTGYGRVVRTEEGYVEQVVEQKDASEDIRAIKEINAGIYVFNGPMLFEALRTVRADNVQHEYYLPDVFHYFRQMNARVAAVTASNFDEIRGINTLEQLKEAENIFLARAGA